MVDLCVSVKFGYFDVMLGMFIIECWKVIDVVFFYGCVSIVVCLFRSFVFEVIFYVNYIG